VGKSCLVLQLLEEKFRLKHDVTIGVEFGIRYLNVNNTVLKIQIWDTAGQDQFRAITKAYYRGAAAAILVYDISRKDTFINLGKWLFDLRENSNSTMSIIIVGNKCDLEDKRQVSFEEGLKFANENATAFIETSAKNKINVIDAFSEVSKMVLSKIESGIIDITNDKNGVKSGNIGGKNNSSIRIKSPELINQNKNQCCSKN